MSLNSVTEIHPEKIFSLYTDIAVIKTEHKYLWESLDKILDSVKKTEFLILKIESLEKKTIELETLIHQKTDFKGKMNRFAFSTKYWIVLITFLAMVGGYIIEII